MKAAWQAGPPSMCRSSSTRCGLYSPTAVHKTDRLAELVCSNSFRSDAVDNAVGLLKEEMRRLGSLIMRAAECRVCRPAPRSPSIASLRRDGGGRDRESQPRHPRRARRRHAHSIQRRRRDRHRRHRPADLRLLSRPRRRAVGGDHLSFYDAISPIILADRSTWRTPFLPRAGARSFRGHSTVTVSGDTSTGTDTVQCPRAQLWSRRRGGGLPELPDRPGAVPSSFYDALIAAEKTAVHEFDERSFSRAVCRSR